MAKAKRKLSIFEIIWYSLTGGLGLWGLTFIVLGVIARNLRSDSALSKANAKYAEVMKLGYFESGIILLVIGVVLAIVVLLINAKKSDREVEKQQRRAARLASVTGGLVEQPVETEEAVED